LKGHTHERQCITSCPFVESECPRCTLGAECFPVIRKIMECDHRTKADAHALMQVDPEELRRIEDPNKIVDMLTNMCGPSIRKKIRKKMGEPELRKMGLQACSGLLGIDSRLPCLLDPRFSIFHGDVLAPLMYPNYAAAPRSGLVVCGGSLEKPMSGRTSDVDLFMVIGRGRGKDSHERRQNIARRLVRDFIERMSTRCHSVVRSKDAITIRSSSGTPYQLVFRVYTSVNDILASFDLPSSMRAWWPLLGDRIAMNRLAILSLLFGINPVFPENSSLTMAQRLAKKGGRYHPVFDPDYEEAVKCARETASGYIRDPREYPKDGNISVLAAYFLAIEGWTGILQSQSYSSGDGRRFSFGREALEVPPDTVYRPGGQECFYPLDPKGFWTGMPIKTHAPMFKKFGNLEELEGIQYFPVTALLCIASGGCNYVRMHVVARNPIVTYISAVVGRKDPLHRRAHVHITELLSTIAAGLIRRVDKEKGLECSVCLSSDYCPAVNAPLICATKHRLCKSCKDLHFAGKGKAKCPLCRGQIRKSEPVFGASLDIMVYLWDGEVPNWLMKLGPMKAMLLTIIFHRERLDEFANKIAAIITATP